MQAIDAGTCSASISRIAVQAGGNAAPGIWLKDNAGDMTSLFSVSVPSLQFETVVGQIAKLGNVVEKSVTATDLTLAVNNANQTVSSLEAQLSQAKTPQTALGQASTDASQPNATKLQAKLAQAQAQLQQLEQQASTAEIFIKITQTANPAPTPDTQR